MHVNIRTTEEKLRELTLALQEMKRQRLYEQEVEHAKLPKTTSEIPSKPSNPCPCASVYGNYLIYIYIYIYIYI